MRLTGKRRLAKLKKKNNSKKLKEEVDALISVIEKSEWKTPEDMKLSRPDADRVHPDGFYIFNIAVHRTM